MIKAHIIFRKNGTKLKPIRVEKEFADHAEMEAFRSELMKAEKLSDVRFLYTDFSPKQTLTNE